MFIFNLYIPRDLSFGFVFPLIFTPSRSESKRQSDEDPKYGYRYGLKERYRTVPYLHNTRSQEAIYRYYCTYVQYLLVQIKKK
jgi:hypothetical protein